MITAAQGWLASGVACGTKASGSLDLALVVSDRPATVAGAFTTSKVPSAHVQHAKPIVSGGTARGFCVTAGIANAFTGPDGLADAEQMAALAAKAAGAEREEMLVAATGTIGRRLPMDRIARGIEKAAGALSRDGGAAAAEAICTTDAFPKTASRTIEMDGGVVTVGGMAKGAGMIAPDMKPHHTLLVFLTTDAVASPESLRSMVAGALPRSFNAITVDGCMSTSDSILLFANGASGVEGEGSEKLARAVTEVMSELAYAVVADGEGASRVIRVRISGAATPEDAYLAAKEVASSILVRSAVFGGDPNYGRVVQALGQAPVALDPAKLVLRVAGVELNRGGKDGGRVAEAAKALAAGGDAVLEADLGLGEGSFEYLTSDLTPDYVRFNAEFTT